MATQAHSYARTARRGRPTAKDATAKALPRPVTKPEQHAWPTDVQVWNWAESAVLFGYGPAASNFF